MNPVEIGAQVPRLRNGIMRRIGALYLKTTGWRITGDLPDLPKFLFIGAPHSSNWDFLLAMAFRFYLELDIAWFAKQEFVNSFANPLLRRMGGIAVDRESPNGLVGQIVDEFNRNEQFLLALSPEGTRRRVLRWKTGFYYIAHGAHVPVVPVAIKRFVKEVEILPPFWTTDDVEADIALLRSRCEVDDQ